MFALVPIIPVRFSTLPLSSPACTDWFSPVICPPAADGVPPVPPALPIPTTASPVASLDESLPSFAVREARGNLLQLEDGDVVARVVPDHGRVIRLAVAVGRGDPRRALDNVVVGQNLTVRAQDDSRARAGAALVPELRS